MEYEVKTVGGKVQEVGGQPVVTPRDYEERRLREKTWLWEDDARRWEDVENAAAVVGMMACAISGAIVGFLIGYFVGAA